MAALLAATTVAAVAPATAQSRIDSPIRSGTPVVLRTAETVSADDRLKVGRTFSLELSQPIGMDGHATIPTGTSATATIVSVAPAADGRPGRVVARLRDLRYGDRRIRLAGGLEGTGMGIASIPAGLVVRGYVDEDVQADPLPAPVVAAAPVITAPAIRADAPQRVAVVPASDGKAVARRDPTLSVVADGAEQGSPALVALAPSTAVPAAPVVREASTAVAKRTTVRVVRRVKRADGVVDTGGVVTRYTY